MKMWAAIRGAEFSTCWYCGKYLPRSRDRTHDHVVPRGQGGDKFVTSCATCNVAKGDLSVEEYRELVWEQRGQVEAVVWHGEERGWEAW